jgi:hypothetical protein
VIELPIAVAAAGDRPEATGSRKVTVQRPSGAADVIVVLEIVGTTVDTGSVAEAAAEAFDDPEPEGAASDALALGPWLEGDGVT